MEIESITFKDRRDGSTFTLLNKEEDNFFDLFIKGKDGSKQHFILQSPNVIDSIVERIRGLKFSSTRDLIQK